MSAFCFLLFFGLQLALLYDIPTYSVKKLGTGKMRLVRPPASGASSMVKSWVRIMVSFSDMVRVMVSVRGRVWIG